MPLITIDLSPQALASDRRQTFVEAVTEAARVAEGIADDPIARMRCIVILRNLGEGDIYWGGTNADTRVRGFFATLYASAGVLDGARREGFASAFEAAAIDPGDARMLVTSIRLVDVPEGSWGRGGTIVRLPQMAHAAGFEHLKVIARP